MKWRMRLAPTALVITLLAGLLTYHWASRPAPVDPNESLPDLAARLQGKLPGLCVVPARPDGEYDGGAYLCDSSRPLEELSWKELSWLRRNPKWAARWTGVVFCERTGADGWRRVACDDWGDNGLVAGPFLFFGDAALIPRIREALR